MGAASYYAYSIDKGGDPKGGCLVVFLALLIILVMVATFIIAANSYTHDEIIKQPYEVIKKDDK